MDAKGGAARILRTTPINPGRWTARGSREQLSELLPKPRPLPYGELTITPAYRGGTKFRQFVPDAP
jgi:hypothetical protein